MIKIFFVVELLLLFVIGLGIGLGGTLLWIFATVVIGVLSMRWALRQGAGHVFLGGIFLIFPGYITDGIGVLLVLNFPLLSVLYSLGIITSMQNMGGGMGMNNAAFGQYFSSTKYAYRPRSQQEPNDSPMDNIIDGDFTRKDD